MNEEVVLVSAARTAIGAFGGALKDVAPAELGRIVIVEALNRAGVSPDDVGHVVMGQVMPTSPQDAYLARVAAVKAGIPVSTPALTLNRLGRVGGRYGLAAMCIGGGQGIARVIERL
jgi:acetyl-CoA C-acetyltransferase